jgi:hypothetical protein
MLSLPLGRLLNRHELLNSFKTCSIVASMDMRGGMKLGAEVNLIEMICCIEG